MRRREEEGRRLRESVDAVKGGVERGLESWIDAVISLQNYRCIWAWCQSYGLPPGKKP